jgi:citrate lyase subunit beta/citryl-CoA lyase
MVYRSLLFVPSNNKRFIEKAKGLRPDIICLDLEDSVGAKDKQTAREMIKESLFERSQFSTNNLFVRINSVDSELALHDLKEIVQKGIDGIVIPKVNSHEEINHIAHILSILEERRGIKLNQVKIIPSIESVEAVNNASSISKSNKRICDIVFGIFDFLYSMGLDYDQENSELGLFARSKIAIDAKASGIEAIDGIWQDVNNIEGLRKDTKLAKSLGYSGKSIIHPTHIDVVNSIFIPSEAQIKWAKIVKESLENAIERGEGKAAVKLDGKMIDAVHYKQAKALLDLVNQ